VVNARVATDPELLRSAVEEAVADVAKKHAARAEVAALQSFRPGRPVPTHRVQ
jgi:hypothetical protein